jgi:hypothetical protein
LNRLRWLWRVLALAGFWPPAPGASGETDFVYKPEFALCGSCAEKGAWSLSLEPELTADAQQAGEVALVGEWGWLPADFLEFGPGLKYVAKGEDPHSNEVRPSLDIKFKLPAGECKLEIRNRIEYRIREGKNESWRYRGRIKVKLPRIGQARPFLYDEQFYDFSDNAGLNERRPGVGVAIPLGERLGLELDLRCVFTRDAGPWEAEAVQFLTVFEYSL